MLKFKINKWDRTNKTLFVAALFSLLISAGGYFYFTNEIENARTKDPYKRFIIGVNREYGDYPSEATIEEDDRLRPIKTNRIIFAGLFGVASLGLFVNIIIRKPWKQE